jgi:hypothetical protein
MSVGGNVIVSLAWFGAAFIVSNHGRSHNGMPSYWPLALFVGINLCFIMMGLTPSAESRPKNV